MGEQKSDFGLRGWGVGGWGCYTVHKGIRTLLHKVCTHGGDFAPLPPPSLRSRMSPLHESIPAPLTCYGVILPLNCERVLFGLDFNVVTKTILKHNEFI